MFILKHNGNEIEFFNNNIPQLGLIDYNNELWENIKNDSWGINPFKKEPKYIYSNTKRKSLHRIVMDYYFGENIVKNFYDKDYVIEHIDNNGFNCKIENLYFLKEIKNRYNGQYFDKNVKEDKGIIALSIFHVFSSHTFQITIGFNDNVTDNTGKILSDVKFLYYETYDIVLQDAENMLESIIETKYIDFEEFSKKYRFTKHKVNYRDEIYLTDEEAKNYHKGMILKRLDEYYIELGYEKKNTNGEIKYYGALMDKVVPDKNLK